MVEGIIPWYYTTIPNFIVEHVTCVLCTGIEIEEDKSTSCSLLYLFTFKFICLHVLYERVLLFQISFVCHQ